MQCCVPCFQSLRLPDSPLSGLSQATIIVDNNTLSLASKLLKFALAHMHVLANSVFLIKAYYYHKYLLGRA